MWNCSNWASRCDWITIGKHFCRPCCCSFFVNRCCCCGHRKWHALWHVCAMGGICARKKKIFYGKQKKIITRVRTHCSMQFTLCIWLMPFWPIIICLYALFGSSCPNLFPHTHTHTLFLLWNEWPISACPHTHICPRFAVFENAIAIDTLPLRCYEKIEWQKKGRGWGQTANAISNALLL